MALLHKYDRLHIPLFLKHKLGNVFFSISIYVIYSFACRIIILSPLLANMVMESVFLQFSHLEPRSAQKFIVLP